MTLFAFTSKRRFLVINCCLILQLRFRWRFWFN